MTSTSKEILQAALALSPRSRANLASKLLESLQENQENIAAWTQEINKRIKANDRGEEKLVPAKKVFESIKKRKKW